MSKMLNKQDLLDVAMGAGFMGSGGGGPLTTGLNLVKNLPEDAQVELIDVDEMENGKLTAIVADMGAPAAMLAIKTSDSMVEAFANLQAYCETIGENLGYCLPVEVGGENTIVPLVVAQSLVLPCIDADGAGRAVPSLTQTTMYGAGIEPRPAFLANEESEAIGVWAQDTNRLEEIARPILEDGFKEQAGLAMWPMTREQLAKAAPIHGNIEVARQLGRRLRESTGDAANMVRHFFEEKDRGGFLLITGTLEDYEVKTTGGFDLGIATLHDRKSGKTVRTYSQNENLMAWCDDCSAPLAMAPDSICYLTTDGQPFSNADIEPMELKGREVAIIGLIADREIRNNEKIKESFRAALQALGYAGPYVPIEEIKQDCAPQ